MNSDIVTCQILIYVVGIIIGFLTQILYPFVFLTIGCIIVSILIKYTMDLIEKEAGYNKLEIRIR